MQNTSEGSWLYRAIASRWFRELTLVWFVFQSVYMAISTRIGISPDELYHYSLIKIFAHNGWLPFIHSQYGDFTPGDAVHNSFFLYHYLLSLPYHLFSGSASAYIYLRLINIGIILLAFYFFFRLAKRLKTSAAVTNLSLFMLVNTLMFVFLAGMLNYDSLFVLLGLISLDLLFALLDKFRARELIAIVAVWLAGVLTVINFYPVVLAEFVILAYCYRHSLPVCLARFKKTWRLSFRLNVLLVALAVLLAGLFTQRSGLDLVRFHSLSPSCDRTYSLAQCQQSAGFNLDQTLSKIHPTTAVQSVVTYMGTWLSDMKVRTFGIFGHKQTSDTRLIKYWVYIVIAAGLIAFVRLWRRKDVLVSLILGIFIFYSAVLYYDNYHAYHRIGVSGAAVQGRYWFMFLPVLYLIINIYIFRLLKHKTLILNCYIALSLLIFITASLPSYLAKTNSSWYTSQTTTLNQKLHNKLSKIAH